MKIEEIRRKIRMGYFSVTDHALTESFKDGITIDDIFYCINQGKIIEEYPVRKRCLIHGKLPAKIPLHVVMDYSNEEDINIITTYIPDSREWLNSQIRKKKGIKHEKE